MNRDNKVVHFTNNLASNLSRFIHKFLWKQKRKIFLKELEEAYKAQNNDSEFQEEVSVWDATVNDGLNA